ncbi:uncharacterized protein fs(1)M3 [Drosophila montana]|uniref:uncharacterized protein fs(1)M3 n=1 Tax=Drosophila montana TaxID=40370 RepID=UPI00313D6208
MWPYMLSMELLFVLLCVFHFIKCQGQGHGEGEGHGADAIASICRRDANGSSLSVEIRLPFMDMELRHERHLHVLRAQQLLLVLHGNELFQLQMSGRDKRLVRLGELTGRVGQQLATAAAVVLWREYLLLAVALPESLEFYQLAQQAMLDANQRHFEPIQEFALAGSLQQLHLVQPNPEQVLLLLTHNVTQSQTRCRTYEWLETYFNPVEELTLPALKAFQVVGRQPHYIITGRTLRGQSKLVLTIYELLTPTLRLMRRQSLTVQARHLLAARFRGRNLLFACAGGNSSTCILFRMVDGHFVVYRKHVLRQLQFSHLAASELGQLLVGARANGQVLVFNSQRLDCYSGFRADTNPSGIYTHRNPLNESFLLLSYNRNPSTTLLRMVQLVGANDAGILAANLEGNDDLSSVQQHRHEFEQSINGLRSLLLRRRQQLDAVHQLLESLEQQQHTLRLTQPLHLRSGSRIQLVQLQGSHLATPMQLLRRMERLRQRHGHAVVGRSTRSFGAGNASYTSAQDTLKARRLHVQNLIYHGQLLPGYHVDSSSPPNLSIKGQLLTKRLHTQQLLIPPSYKRPQRSLDVHTVVRHLQVERINNVSWFEFYDSLFLHSRDNEIEGRLVLQARARVVNLQTPLLNGKLVEQLFNLRQPQVVTSNIFMSAFIAPKLDANLVNGLNFAKDIVFRGARNNLIKTPVRIYRMSVSGDIFVENETKRPRQMAAEQRPFNLQQYYRGRIILNGSLTVNNLQRDTNETRLQLGGQSLRARDLHADYLLLQTPQHLDTLAFGNAKVTTRALSTQHINGHPTAEHLLTGAGHELNMSRATHKRLHLIFMSVRIDGSVYCGNYSSRLAQLARDAVRQGETANITGHKSFAAPLDVDMLSSRALNGLPVDELVLKSQLSQNFTNLKLFPRIVVKSQLEIGRNLTALRLNHMELSQLLQPAYSLQRLELPEMPKLQQLIFRRLNGLAFDELLGKLSVADGEPVEQPLLLRKQLIIEGNVRFKRPLQLRTLNAIHWDEYVKGLVSANANSLIVGEKRFLEPVLITDALHAPTINGLDLSALLENTLLRTTPQSIGGVYSFARLTATNVDVAQLNGMPASSFLDLGQPSLRLQGDLYVPELQLNGSLSCVLLNDPLPRLDAQLAALQQRNWRRLMVLGDALWPQASDPQQQQQQQLDYLRLHAVRRRAASQIISGHVILQQPLLGHLHASESLLGGLNISHIAEDALLRRSTVTQLVKAPQTMLQKVRARSISLLKDGQFELLNGIDLRRLNGSLYRRSSGQPMGAQLRFQLPPNITQLRLLGGLNGGHHVANIYEQSPGGIWPAVQLRELQLQQRLQLHEINGMSLEYLLEQRVPLRGAALELFDTLHFERLVLGERAMLRTINGIDLQRVVYKHGQRPQAIGGAKTFAKGIEFQGPAHIMRLNGRDLSESYQQSIYTDRDYSIDSLVLDGASFQGGLLADAALSESRQAPQMVLELELGQHPQSAREQLRQQLQELMQQLQSNRANHSQRLLYLDYEQQRLELTWSAPAADEILQLVAAQTPQPQSGICQLQQLLAQISTRQQRVHLTNVSLASRLLRASSGRAAIRVKAQNYCNQPLQQFRSRVHISCRGHAHTLGLRQHVEALQLHDQQDYSLLLISGTDEVRVLRVNHTNCSLSDWQSVQPASAGRLMKLLQLEGNRTLLLTSGLQQPEHLPVVAVHRLDAQSQRFELLQHIEGDYDLAELQSEQLLLSCHSCRHISVHVFSPAAEQFVPLQQLRLAARIHQLLPFSVAQERHLLVLTMPGSKHFYLFSYAHIEGWQQRTYGRHMSDFQWSWPLIRSGQELTTSAPVLLLCGQRFCSLVKALLD